MGNVWKILKWMNILRKAVCKKVFLKVWQNPLKIPVKVLIFSKVKKNFFLNFFLTLLKINAFTGIFQEHLFWFPVVAFTAFEVLYSKKRNSAHSSSYLFQFFNLPSFSVSKVVRNRIICMKQSKFDWQNHLMPREYDSKLWISLFYLWLFQHGFAQKAIVWLSLTSASVNWALPPWNEGIFNLTFKSASSFLMVKPLSAMIELLSFQRFLFSTPLLFTISLSDIDPLYSSLMNVIAPEDTIPSTPLWSYMMLIAGIRSTL